MTHQTKCDSTSLNFFIKGAHHIHISDDIQPYPAEHEISAAIIVSEHFHNDVVFVKRSQNSKTADFKINNLLWELKSPTGNGKHTMQNNIRKANQQSHNIIIDLRRCRMCSSQALSRIRSALNKVNHIKRLIVIRKNQKIIVLQ